MDYKQILKLMTGKDDWRITGRFDEGAGEQGRVHGHGATDFAVPEGTEFRAPATAEIVFEQFGINQTYTPATKPGTLKDFGNVMGMYIKDWDRTYLLAHIMYKGMYTNKGEIHAAGSLLVKSGNTGYSFGPHMHIAVAKGRHTSIASVRANAIDFELDIVGESSPSEFQSYEYGIAKGVTLYDRKGNAYPKGTTNSHTVTIIEEVNGMGKFRAPWLIGVSEAYVKLHPTPSKPVSDIGKSWTPKNVPLKLYPQSTGDTNYGSSRTSRTYKILAEANGRVQIQHKLFDAPGNKVWVVKSDGKVG